MVTARHLALLAGAMPAIAFADRVARAAKEQEVLQVKPQRRRASTPSLYKQVEDAVVANIKKRYPGNPEHEAWNEEVERKKREKKQRT